MQKLKSNLLWGLILFWLGVAEIYWNLAPHIAGYNSASLHTSAYLILKSITLVGPDLLVILLGYYLYNHLRKEAVVIKIWLNMLALGCLLSLLLAFTDNGINYYPTTIYNSLFPVLRNSYPLISGIMGGVIVSSFFSAQQVRAQQRLVILA